MPLYRRRSTRATRPTRPTPNLATLIRLCRIDFGIRIQIDTVAADGLKGPTGSPGPTPPSARFITTTSTRASCPGVLVYIKISMTGDEPPDLQNYAQSETNFPYQPTDLRQSFDEQQFECYRCLGDHIASEVFEDGSTGYMVRPAGPTWSTSLVVLGDPGHDGTTRPSWKTRISWSRPRRGSHCNTISGPTPTSPG